MEAQQTSKTQPAKQNLLTKKDVQRSFWRWTFFPIPIITMNGCNLRAFCLR